MEFQQIFKCKTCGQPLNKYVATSTDGLVECPSCRNVWIIPKKETSPEALQFLRIGDHDLDTGKFEDSFVAYKKAADINSNEPEAFFGMALASHKVQYLKVEATKPDEYPRLQPICYEFSKKRFADDKNYQRALELADINQKAEYIKKAEEIDDIRTEFNRLKESGLDYDCFICVKVSDDENGGNTQDSHHALQIYHHLKDNGYTPFYSEEEVKERAGTRYEALILYALYTSECMLIVCSNEEYLRTPWVKNEYLRFSQMMANDDKEYNAITFVFKDNPIERLPGLDGKIQGIDLNKPDAYIRIEKYISSFKPIAIGVSTEIQRKEYAGNLYKKRETKRKGVTKRELITIGGGEITVSDRSKLSIASSFLNRKDFDNATRFIDNILKENPANSEAYWLRFLAELKCSNVQEFITYQAKYSNTINFESLEKAIACTQDGKYRQWLYSVLYQRVIRQNDLHTYCEYIELPDSTDEDISELTEVMYRVALSTLDTVIFDEIIKTVTDTDKYISMNLEFAHALPISKATPYYKNILSADEGHKEALYCVFIAEHGYNYDSVFSYCSSDEAIPLLEEKLFTYGYNKYANNCLMELCLKFAETQTDSACRLMDFILSMIPKSQDKTFTEYLNKFIDMLFKCKKVKHIAKYNELLLTIDKLDDNAYFNRIMLKHNYYNALQLIGLSGKLLDDEDFFSAINSFTEKYPDKSNLYLDINDVVTDLANTVKTPDCREFVTQALYLKKEEIPSCKSMVLAALQEESQRCLYAVMHENRCESVEELYLLRKDVSSNPNLHRAYRFAQEAKSNLESTIKNILTQQGAASRMNVERDESVARYARAQIRAKRTYIFFVVFAVVCAFAMIITLIAAMAKADGLYMFFLVLFNGNSAAIYGVGIALIILPFLASIVFLIILAWQDRRALSALFMSIIFGISIICYSVGAGKWINAKSESSSTYIGDNYILNLSRLNEGWQIDLFSGDAETVVIPSSYGGEPIIAIGEEAFSDHRSTLKNVVIPDTVITIGERAFKDNFGLVSLTIGKGVKSIGYGAFDHCFYMEKLYISDISAWCNIVFSMSGTGYAYYERSSNPLLFAKTIYINNQLVSSLVIPEDVRSISAYAFYNSKFESVYISKNVITININAFGYCAATIYCEQESKPIDWDVNWRGVSSFGSTSILSTVVWGYDGH